MLKTPPIQGGGRIGASPPPLDFLNLKRKSTVTHHSNRKRDKRKKEKVEINRFWSYDGQGNPPTPLFPPSYNILSPFFFIKI